jgi:HK97 gp10 family phage protein
MSYRWYGDKMLKEYENKMGRNLDKAAIHLQNQIKKNLGSKARSSPGDYPGLETGELRRSITHETDKSNLVAKVGTNKVYAKYLEKGTGKMAPRPFLDRTLQENQTTIKRIITEG